jgi:hypothetical protein
MRRDALGLEEELDENGNPVNPVVDETPAAQSSLSPDEIDALLSGAQADRATADRRATQLAGQAGSETDGLLGAKAFDQLANIAHRNLGTQQGNFATSLVETQAAGNEKARNALKERLMASRASAEEPLKDMNARLQLRNARRTDQFGEATQQPKTDAALADLGLDTAKAKSDVGQYQSDSPESDIAEQQMQMAQDEDVQIPEGMEIDAATARRLTPRQSNAMKDRLQIKQINRGDQTGTAIFDPKTGKIIEEKLDIKSRSQSQGRSGQQIQSDLLRKDYEKEAQDVREMQGSIKTTRNMFEIAKQRPEAVGILQYNVARSIAGEKGPLSNQDVQRAGLGSMQVFDQLLQTASTRGLGALTPGQQKALEELLTLSEERQQKKIEGIGARYDLRAKKVGADLEYITGEQGGKQSAPVQKEAPVQQGTKKIKVNSADELP